MRRIFVQGLGNTELRSNGTDFWASRHAGPIVKLLAGGANTKRDGRRSTVFRRCLSCKSKIRPVYYRIAFFDVYRSLSQCWPAPPGTCAK